MGKNPVIRFPSATAVTSTDSRVQVSTPEPQRRIIRQPVPLPLPRSQRTHQTGDTVLKEASVAESILDPGTPWLHATGKRTAGQPCRREATPATRGAFELDVSADFYTTKADELPPALFGYWLPRSCQTSRSRGSVAAAPLGPEILGYNDPSTPQPPSVLGYLPFHRPQPAEG